MICDSKRRAGKGNNAADIEGKTAPGPVVKEENGTLERSSGSGSMRSERMEEEFEQLVKVCEEQPQRAKKWRCDTNSATKEW